VSDFSKVVVISNSRAEAGPLQSVIAEMPGAVVLNWMPRLIVEPVAQRSADALQWFDMQIRRLNPSVVVVLGDRYETLSAALAAMFLRVKIVHIHGGETTTGSFDNALRHGITHLAEQSGGAHCVATDDAKNRVFELGGGDNIKRIHITGAPGLDGIPGNSARRDTKLILVTYHPVTMATDYGLGDCRKMLELLRRLNETHAIVFCGVNTDPGANEIRALIGQCGFGEIRENMSHDLYISLMQSAVLVIGNSSAGVIEAPWVGVPSINIGDRQSGREMAGSVFHSLADIHRALLWKGPSNPIYCGGAAPRIAAVVAGLINA